MLRVVVLASLLLALCAAAPVVPKTKGCPRAGGHQCNLQGLCFKGTCYCRPGMSGDACHVASCMPSCGANGECRAGKCLCDSGFAGADCATPTCPGTNCTGHGMCKPDHGNAGKLTCYCEPGWRAKDCSAPLCPMGGTDQECGGNGQCSLDGICTCHRGWTGRSCNEATCREPCHNGGTCTKKLKCACLKGFEGDRCEVKLCPHHCRGRGKCNGNGECVCAQGWRGKSCDRQTCPLDATTHLECSDNGVCKNGICACLPGFAGRICETLLCPNNCHHGGRQGECLNDKCECYPGYAGVDCSVQLVVKKQVGTGEDTSAQEDDSGVCGEDCDTKCSKHSGCTIHTEELFTFETIKGQMYKITVPITRSTGHTFDKWVSSQNTVQGKEMPAISSSAATDRTCVLRCLRGCKARCFDDLHKLGPAGRAEVIKARDLATKMPGITGSLIADAATSMSGNNATAGNLDVRREVVSGGRGMSEGASDGGSES